MVNTRRSVFAGSETVYKADEATILEKKYKYLLRAYWEVVNQGQVYEKEYHSQKHENSVLQLENHKLANDIECIVICALFILASILIFISLKYMNGVKNFA
jgi:hypothetical protein